MPAVIVIFFNVPNSGVETAINEKFFDAVERQDPIIDFSLFSSVKFTAGPSVAIEWPLSKALRRASCVNSEV